MSFTIRIFVTFILKIYYFSQLPIWGFERSLYHRTYQLQKLFYWIFFHWIKANKVCLENKTFLQSNKAFIFWRSITLATSDRLHEHMEHKTLQQRYKETKTGVNGYYLLIAEHVVSWNTRLGKELDLTNTFFHLSISTASKLIRPMCQYKFMGPMI